tara:strand:+ start:302 stop:979 length:678 start_codon:yes stop_codon:yes gene_type:complete
MIVGESTTDLVKDVFSRGIDRVAVLMRHSAREYTPGQHDLTNPLTDEGRFFASALGHRLPAGLCLRGYSSPPGRCMETAQLIMEAYREDGGDVTRNRPLEGLGIFYVLDQRKMWKILDESDGLYNFMELWFQHKIPDGVMIDPDNAAGIILRMLVDRLNDMIRLPQLDICVSHDMTLYLLRERLLGQGLNEGAVGYLDAIVAYKINGELWLETALGPPVRADIFL